MTIHTQQKRKKQDISECTVLRFEGGLLGQNWDWVDALEELIVILDITDTDGHRMITITEPGMLAKIGINSSGLGVTLNYLEAIEPIHPSYPIHIFLRLALESKTVGDFKTLVESVKHNTGSASAIVCSSPDEYVHFEFTPTNVLLPNKVIINDNGLEVFSRTNHYLGLPEEGQKITKCSSSRYSKSCELLELIEDLTIEDMKGILLNNEGEKPICRDKKNGTRVTVIMDLPNQTIHYTKGNPFTNQEFFTLSLTSAKM
eukprot:TRINITY_DN1149_c0_g1_i3.p1 TRINITY_DN1149_c0_g1~~TRINITY_DN1149_c0_g1_i3.p1  ORF type:complete len:259 (+),score=37.16 TRINITY_DN1149_c0_g1_i3:350-1126(+)